MRRFLALFVAVCSLSACAQATEIVLVVDTDLMVPSELTRIDDLETHWLAGEDDTGDF